MSLFLSVLLERSENMDVSRATLKMIFGDKAVEEDFDGVLRSILLDPEGYRQKVLDKFTKKRNENLKVCAKCGGKCCKTAPCHYSPSDFKDLSYKAMKKVIKKTGYIAILKLPGHLCELIYEDLHVDRPDFYVLRVRTKCTGIATEAGKIADFDECINLTPTGCKLSYDERPMGARLLIPRSKEKCMQLYNMEACTADWEKHQEVLRKLYKYFEKKQRKKKF